ncbi:hypothetical protein EJ02DRAFT_420912 [Clathrospora elynae]|uniref:DDE-1 domain-containing protein n=1 Tax=Clathrospora elynae TaxID=706981 RepID=A0A6A5SVZ6_9PLEO|nr:hypothetical protein EJ02DRAFT_420912 [Clathrospora elynae]
MYCVLGYDFAFAIPYNADNSNGKMNTKTYINTILPALRSYILEHGKPRVQYYLWQDWDSAHISQRTLKWMDEHGMPYILSSSKSPNMSIMETWVLPLRRRFHAKGCNTEAQGLKRFYEVWREIKPSRINRTIDHYPQRLRNIRDKYNGLASKY